MKVLSLFDGMSCGRIALERAGIPVTHYFASEIDKHAIKVSEANYPDIIRLGDVTKITVEYDELMDQTTVRSENGVLTFYGFFDLIIAGSPCQGFSFAGKQLNFNDPRSVLFFEFVRLVEECRNANPDLLFLLENVKMKKEYQAVISKAMGVEPIEINSALVSAQNRKRLYWTNINDVDQPEDKGILLRDILEDVPFDKLADGLNTNPSSRGMNGKIHTGEKSPCLTTNKGEGAKIGIVNIATVPGCKRRDRSNIVSDEGKSPCLTSVQGGGQEPKVAMNKASIIGRRLDENGIRKDYDKSVPITQVLEVRASNTDKSGYLTTVDKDNVLTHLPAGRYVDVYTNKIPYRKLTPVECERLQTVPDNYTAAVSNSQRYKMLGNGWNVDTIVHIFKNIPC